MPLTITDNVPPCRSYAGATKATYLVRDAFQLGSSDRSFRLNAFRMDHYGITYNQYNVQRKILCPEYNSSAGDTMSYTPVLSAEGCQ